MVAITNDQELSDFRQHKCIVLEFCRSEVQHKSHWAKTKMLAGLRLLLEALEENLLHAASSGWLPAALGLIATSPSSFRPAS